MHPHLPAERSIAPRVVAPAVLLGMVLAVLAPQAPAAAQDYKPGVDLYGKKQWEAAAKSLEAAVAKNGRDVYVSLTWLGASYVELLHSKKNPTVPERLELLGRAYSAFNSASGKKNLGAYQKMIDDALRTHVCADYGVLLQECARNGGLKGDKDLTPLVWHGTLFLKPAEQGKPGATSTDLYRAANSVLTRLCSLGGAVALLRLETKPAKAAVAVDDAPCPGLSTPCDLALLMQPEKPKVTVTASIGKYKANSEVSLRKGKLPVVLVLPASLVVTGATGTWKVKDLAGDHAPGEEVFVPLGKAEGEKRTVVISAAGYETKEAEVTLVACQQAKVGPIELTALGAEVVVTAEGGPGAGAAAPQVTVTAGGAKLGPYAPGEKFVVALKGAELPAVVTVSAAGYVQEGGPLTAVLKPGPNPLKVKLVAQSGWLLPFAPACESTATVGNAAPLAVAVGAKELPWSGFAPGAAVAIAAKDGPVYYRGKLVEENQQRKVVDDRGGFITGGLDLKGEAAGLTDVRLEPVKVAAPGAAAATTPEQWAKLPIGTYRFSAKLKLPGLQPLDLRNEALVVAEGKLTAQSLAELVLPLLPTLKERVVTCPLAITVASVRVVDGKAETPAPLASMQVKLTPGKLRLADAREQLAGLGLPKGQITLPQPAEGTTVSDAAGKAAFAAVPEGEYQLTFTGEAIPAVAPRTVTVPTEGAVALTVTRRFATLPLKPQAGWKVFVGDADCSGDLSGDLLSLKEGQQGAVVIRNGETELWRGKLQDGRISADGGGLVRGDFELAGLPAGQKAQLVPADGKVAAAAGWADGDLKAPEEGSVRWKEVPAGTYLLRVPGFAPREIAVPGEKSLNAEALLPDARALRLAPEAPLTLDALRRPVIAAVSGQVPYLALHPQASLDLASLPVGNYTLTVAWPQKSLYCRKAFSLPAEADLKLRAADFTLPLVTVAVRLQRTYLSKDPGGTGDRACPVPDWVQGQMTLQDAAGETWRMTRRPGQAEVFTSEVPPGKYRLQYAVGTLNRQDLAGPAVVCQSEEHEVGPGASDLRLKCDLSAGSTDHALTQVK